MSLWSVQCNDGEGVLELSLMEFERVVATYVENDRLVVQTDLNRRFISTDTKVKYLDMVEEI